MLHIIVDSTQASLCRAQHNHVYVDEAFTQRLGKPGDMEKSMLEFAEDVEDNSRLSCQITITDDLDGLRVTTPEKQH